MFEVSFFKKAKCGLLVCKNDPYSTIIKANDAFFEMCGYTREEMREIHQDRFANIVADDLTEILQKVDNTVRGIKVLDYEYRIKKKSGEIIWIHDVATYDDEGDLFNVVIMDITYKAKALESADRAASIDKLTGLFNRRGLEKKITGILEERKGTVAQAMLFIDLDNFKTVNDTKGHQRGDQLIGKTGHCLRNLLMAKDVVIGRLGGDEFMVFMTDVPSENYMREVSEDIVEILNMSVDELSISGSVGVFYDGLGIYDFEMLYKKADEALYRVKAGGKGSYHLITA